MLPYLSSVHVTSLPCMTAFPFMRLLRLYASFHSALTLSPCVPTFLISTSTGISTCCPSATSFDLTLGPDFPRADQLYSGNLGYSAVRILTLLSPRLPQSRSALLWKPWIFGRKDSHLTLATHSGILSSKHSTPPYGNASPRFQCSSTNHYK